MIRSIHTHGRSFRHLLPALATVLGLAACSDLQPVDSVRQPITLPARTLQAFTCTASKAAALVSCVKANQLNGRAIVIGNQGTNVKLTSSNVSYDPGTDIFQFDVTVQNLLNEAIGTPDGVVADSNGIRVFFNSGPTTTVGSGEVTVANADGTDTFTGSNQPYFRYSEILPKNAVSQAHTWQLNVPQEAETFVFTVFVETEVQYLLVINEVLANPKNPLTDASGEWVEIFNAGSLPVEMQNLVFADSAQSGRRPFNVVSSSLVVQPGAYVVFGNTTNTTNNGGVPVDYAYGAGMALANSLDAVKFARVYGVDTLTIDRTQYASAAISAQDGISRELKNPALDNSNMDGSNWADAPVTATFSNGTVTSRGTPKAQNSTYTP